MKTKLIAILLLISIAFTCIATSCGGKTDGTEPSAVDEQQTESAETTTEVTRVKYTPEKTDYEGAEFRVLNFDNVKANEWTGIPNDIFSEGDTGDALSDAVYKRNMMVEEALNIKITGQDMDNKMTDLIKKSAAAGTGEVDAVFSCMNTVPTLVTGGYLMDMNELGMDMSTPWWDSNSVDELTVNGKLFAAACDITFQDKLSTYVSFFNKQVVANYNLEDPYELSVNGDWTFDKVLAMGEVVNSDIDGNGVYDQHDSYGLSCQNDAVYIMLHAANIPIAVKDEQEGLKFTLQGEKEMSALQRISEIMSDERRFFNRQTFKVDLSGAVAMFTENRVFCLIRPVQSLFIMRNMEADFGIVPLPKMYEDQTTVGSAINPYSGTITVVPITTLNTQLCADALQMMACESHYELKDALYDIVLGTKLIRDELSPVMLDIAFESRVYDIGLLWHFGNIVNVLLQNHKSDIASLIEKNINGVQKEIDDFIEVVNQ